MALEITGFVFTTAALATLFDACVNSLDRIAAYRSFDGEFDGYRSRYALQRQILHDWGARVGIQGGQLLSDHSPLLDEAERWKAVGNALENIEKTLKTGTALVEKYATAVREPSEHHGQRIKDSMRSKSRKIGWGTFGKRNIQENVDQLTSLVASVLQAVPADHMDTAPTYKQQLIAWLGAPATHDALVETANRRLKGTCEWILEKDGVKSWLGPHDKCARVLWINGPAGFGKTYLASALVKRLEHENPDTTFHFFCSHENAERRTPLSILKSWIVQAISRSSRALEGVNKIRVTTGQPQALNLDVWSAFREVVRLVGPLTLTIDGYDECINVQNVYQTTDSRAEFLQTLLETLAGTRTRLLITSREEYFIREPLNSVRKSMILRNVQVDDYTMTQSDVRSDIEALANLMVNAELLSRSFVDRKEVVDQMIRKADGMFLWLRLCQDNIKDWKSPEQLKTDIDATPSKLEKAYGRTIRDIQESEGAAKERAFQTFRLVLFAVAPLTVGQLTEALVMIDSPNIDRFPVAKLPIAYTEKFVQDYILRPCHSLLEVRGQADDQEIKTKTIHFRHFSIKEFLLKRHDPEPGHAAGAFSYSHTQEHSEFLANLCLRYLLLQDFVIEDEFTRGHYGRLNERYLFLRYAAKAWQDHLYEIHEAQDVSKARVKLLMCSTGSFNTWEYVFRQDFVDRKVPFTDRGSPLQYAAWYGDLDTVKALLDRGDDVNDVGGPFGDAVQAGCILRCSQSSEIMELLLEHGAIQHTGVGLFSSALHACVAVDNDDILSLLLGRGWDPLEKNSDGKTTLCLAAELGMTTAFEIILACRASQDLMEDSLKVAYVQDLQAAASKGIALLYAAAKEGNIGILDLLSQHGADLEAVGSETFTVLCRSCSRGQEAVVTWLLEHGATMDHAMPEGVTPILAATLKGHLNIVKMLVLRSCTLDFSDEDGETLLHFAIRAHSADVVEYLLDLGVFDIEARAGDGHTALSVAITGELPRMAMLLIDRGANVHAIDAEGLTALHLAAAINGSQLVMQKLLKHGADPVVQESAGFTALHSALIRDQIANLEFLLDTGLDIEMRTANMSTPLILAAGCGRLKGVECLLHRGANIAAKDENGVTALHVAVGMGHSSVVGLLLDNHANANAQDEGGHTPVHLAAAGGHESIMRDLLDRGANIATKDENGDTALHMAVAMGHSSVVGLLLDNHANTNAPREGGYTPVHVAAAYGHEGILRDLLNRGASVDPEIENRVTALHVAVATGHSSVVGLLLDNHANANAPDEGGYTPVHFAAFVGHESIMRDLLDRGGDIGAQTKDGFTALHIAALKGTPTIVSLLLGYHANANAVTKFGDTPLHLASFRGDESIVQILLSHGVDSSLLNASGKTAYDYAKDKGLVSCLEALTVTETAKMEAKRRSKEARSGPGQSLTLRQRFSRRKSKPSDPS